MTLYLHKGPQYHTGREEFGTRTSVCMTPQFDTACAVRSRR